MPRTPCPTSAEWAAFHLGDLPEADLEELALHLEACPPCQEAVRAFDGLSDATLAAYRQSALSSPLPDGEALPPSVGEYEILGEVGRGGMGIVYRARHIKLQRVVALKMLLGGYFTERGQRLRFRAEAEAVARLQHPHIVQLFEIGEHEVDLGLPRPYFTLEYVAGGNLGQRLAERPLPPAQAAAWLERLAHAVHYAHEHGIIHRDLKPSNILLTSDGQPKICDFGVAKLLTGSDLKTLSGMILGTAEYMAPEQAEAKAATGPTTDVYALGAILYETLTGRPPFKGATTLDTLNQVRTQEPVPLRRLQPLVPRDLETITLKCLAKKPERRYASALDLADDLRRWLNREPIRARPISALVRLVRWCQRRPALAAMGAALCLVSVLGLLGVLGQLLSAEAARAVAVHEKETADAERGRALQLAEDLRRQRDAAEWQAYRANIGAATSALQLHNLDSVRRYVAAAPEKHRNWEWAHLSSLLDPSYAPFRGHKDQVLDMAFSPDGRLIASASADRTVRLWEVATGREIAVLGGHAKEVQHVVFSPDGRRLASTDESSGVRLWDPSTGALLAVLPGQSLDAHSLTFSPDNRFLSVGGPGIVYVWEATTGKPRHQLRDRAAATGTLAFTPNSSRLFRAGTDGTITAWDVERGKLVLSWQAHAAPVTALCVSPDGRCLASGGDFPENAVRLWDAGSGQETATLLGHKNLVHSLVFSPDGSRLVSACWDQTARLWDRRTARALAILPHRGRVTSAAFRPDDTQLVTRGDDQTLRLWDAKTGEPLTVLSIGAEIARWGTSFSPDGTRLACASSNHQVLLWDVKLLERNGVLRGHTGYVYDVAFSPDGTQIASAAWDGTVRLWDAISQRPIKVLQHDERLVLSVVFSSAGKQLVSAAKGPGYPTHGRVYVWELATGRRRYTGQTSRDVFEDTRAAVNQDASLGALATHRASAELFDLSSGQARRVLGEPQGSSSDVAFSTDGRELATAERDGTVRLWDVATGSPVGVLRGHQAAVACVRYSPDGRWIASASHDFTVRLWDVKTHKELAIFPHGCIVYGLAFSPDCTRLATACQDNTIRLWDVATREEVAELHGHTDYVHAIAWSPDGTRLVSGSGDYTVRVWDSLSAQERTKQRHAKAPK